MQDKSYSQSPSAYTPRIWLTGITSSGKEAILKQGLSPVLEFFHGLIWTFHNPTDESKKATDDPGYQFLEANKGLGRIILRDWVQRHDVSMNETLWAGIIQEGDLVVVVDTEEFMNPRFCSILSTEVNKFMEDGELDALTLYWKTVVFRYKESIQYVGSPHWGLTGINRCVELSKIYQDEASVRKNMRPVFRTDPFQFVDHYARYYLYPFGSNTLCLGLEQNEGDKKDLFQELETNRLEFKKQLKKAGYPLTTDGILSMMKNSARLKEFTRFIEKSKELNDFYRLHILDRKDFKDDHDFKDMVNVNV